MKMTSENIGMRLIAALLCTVIALFGLIAPVDARADTSLSITGIETNSKGETTVKWNGGGSTYSLFFKHNNDTMSITYCFLKDKSNKGIGTINCLAPGETYTIYIQSDMDVDYREYTVPRTNNLDEYKITVRYSSLRYQNPSSSKWDMRQIEKNNSKYMRENLNGTDFYVVTGFGTPTFRDDIYFTMLTVVYGPDGSVYSEFNDKMFVGAYAVRHDWAACWLNRYFSNMIENYGFIYPGRYTVKTYLDNKFVGSDYFDVDSSDRDS